MNYYQLHDYVSNSDLSNFKREMNCIGKPDNLHQIFAFGNLVDSMITGDEFDPREINEAERLRAQAMTTSFWGDAAAAAIFQQMKPQYIYIRKRFRIEYDGFEFFLPFRIKMDGVIKNVLGADIKTTATTTQNAFIDAIDFFDWDRQAAVYMDVAQLDKFVLLGISKKCNKRGEHPIFKFAINRDDEIYKRGKKKYQYLAFLYYHTIHLFINNENKN